MARLYDKSEQAAGWINARLLAITYEFEVATSERQKKRLEEESQALRTAKYALDRQIPVAVKTRPHRSRSLLERDFAPTASIVSRAVRNSATDADRLLNGRKQMDELIRKSDAIDAIKRYALEAYDINLERPEEFAGNSANERFCEGLFEATEVIEGVEIADDRDDIVRCKNCKLWEKYENTAGSGYCHCKKFQFHYGPRMDRIFNPITGPNEYCSFAERKKDERNS